MTQQNSLTAAQQKGLEKAREFARSRGILLGEFRPAAPDIDTGGVFNWWRGEPTPEPPVVSGRKVDFVLVYQFLQAGDYRCDDGILPDGTGLYFKINGLQWHVYICGERASDLPDPADTKQHDIPRNAKGPPS